MTDVIQDLKDEAIFKPAAEALYQKRLEDMGRDYPLLHCLPVGPVQTLGETYRIIQSPTVVALLFNSILNVGDDYRQIFLTGASFPGTRIPPGTDIPSDAGRGIRR